MKKQWKETGWNGTHLKTPPEWEPGEIGRSYLLFESNGLPVLELKWGKIKGRFSPKPLLRKLAPAKSRRKTGTFGQWSPPAAWQKALADFQCHGFIWSNASLNAKGLLLYCDFCKTATLLQFFHHNDTVALDKMIPLRILDSLRDHGKEDNRLWSLYDIRARIPNVFDLADFQFRTGQFMLSFKRGKQWLGLRRWSPASILLNRQSLEAFAAENMAGPQDGHEMYMRAKANVVEGVVTPVTGSSAGFGWVKRYLKRKRYQTWRVWRLPEHNRILAVNLEDTQPADTNLFEQIVSAYGIVH